MNEEQSEAILRFVVTIDHLRQIQDSLADLMGISERLERQHARLSIDALLEIQSLFPFYAKHMTVLSELLREVQPAMFSELDEVHEQAQAQVQQSYRRFLVLVRELDDAGELADFLSIHQRLRTKLEAFGSYLRGGSAVPAPPALAAGTGATPTSGAEGLDLAE